MQTFKIHQLKFSGINVYLEYRCSYFWISWICIHIVFICLNHFINRLKTSCVTYCTNVFIQWTSFGCSLVVLGFDPVNHICVYCKFVRFKIVKFKSTNILGGMCNQLKLASLVFDFILVFHLMYWSISPFTLTYFNLILS